MSEIVQNFKEEKDQIEYKLKQFDNLIKCQRHEIESKTALLKQFDLVRKFK